MVLAFSSFAGFGLVSLRAHVSLFFDSLEPAEQVVYGKWAKKEARVVSYFFMTSGWHPCSCDQLWYNMNINQSYIMSAALVSMREIWNVFK